MQTTYRRNIGDIMSSNSSLSREYVPLLPDSNKIKESVNRNRDNNDRYDDYDGFDDWTSDRFTCTRLRTVERLQPQQTTQKHSGTTRGYQHTANMGFFSRFGKELWAFKKTLLFVLIPLLASPLLILSPIGEGVSLQHRQS